MSSNYSDLVELIQACKHSGVSQLKHGDLEIKFHPGDAVETKSVVPSEVANPPSAEKLEEIAVDSAESEKITEMDLELDQMLIDDPAQYEELLVEGELKGDGGQASFE